MTLTTILPTLRRSIPDPIDVNRWPEHTSVTTTDVIVSGVSLLRLSELCETPCVHTAAAVVPGTGGRPSPTEQAAVVIVTVTAVWGEASDELHVEVDACLDGVPAVWNEVRLIGRASVAHTTSARLVAQKGQSATCRPVEAAHLPVDIAAGDLLAIPCRGVVALKTLRRR